MRSNGCSTHADQYAPAPGRGQHQRSNVFSNEGVLRRLLRRSGNLSPMHPNALAASDMRAHVTPVPTPGIVRVGGSTLVALSLAALVSPAAPVVKVGLAAGSVIAALALTLAHPYRREMGAFAEMRNVARVPSISMLVPLMLWWLLLMLAPVVSPWPAWGVLLVFAGVTAVAWLLYPHVDGSRRLAYA